MYFSLPFLDKKEASDISIETMIDAYFKEEVLSGENQISCDGCNKKTNANRSLRIIKPPNIIIFHLKRFAYNNGRSSKINQPVQFPVNNLDIGSFCLPTVEIVDHRYSLFGVIFHNGGCSKGHYTAATKETFTNQWVMYDDEKCLKFSEDEFQSTLIKKKAYLLFYIKKDLKAFRRQTLTNFEKRLSVFKFLQTDKMKRFPK
jgi:ubiquitin C-terminal hydrolase